LRHTFDMGRDIQKRINEVYLRDYMVGMWRCRRCNAKWGPSLYPKSGDCLDDDPHDIEYHEYRLYDKEHHLTGGVDAFVWPGFGKWKLVEIKSIDKDYFKDLKAAKSEHRLRTQLYLWMASRDPAIAADVDTSSAVVLYVSKSFGFKGQGRKGDSPFSPYKEFLVKRNDDALQPYLERAKSLVVAEQLGKTPCGVCVNSAAPRAKTCSVATVCWNGQHPWEITWRNKAGTPTHHGRIVE